VKKIDHTSRRRAKRSAREPPAKEPHGNVRPGQDDNKHAILPHANNNGKKVTTNMSKSKRERERERERAPSLELKDGLGEIDR